jgi:hypothetical protein
MIDYEIALTFTDFDAISLLDQKRVLWSQLWALIRWNTAYLLPRLKTTPLLYKSGVVFQREPDGAMNRWPNIPRVLRDGHGHCVGLSCWRVAELQARGENAIPVLQVFEETRPIGLVTEFHVTVLRGDGTEDHEDPSYQLGMR